MTNNVCQVLVQADASDLWYTVGALFNENFSQIYEKSEEMKCEQCDGSKLHKDKKLRRQQLNCIISADDDLRDEQTGNTVWE